MVISTLLRAAEPMSRAELAKQTGLTKATMSLLVSMLVDNGVVREGTPSVQSSYGRPSTPLLIVGGRYCGIGLQVNTDGYGTIVLDLDGTVVAERWVDADMSDVDADDIFSELNALSLEQERLLADRGYTVTGTGLALPGLVTDDMRLLMARNLGWEQLDLKRFDVVRRLDAPCTVRTTASWNPTPHSSTCPRTSASAARWSVADMWRSATMDSAGNSATCRWSCGDRCAGVGGGGAWRPMPAAGRWWSPQASPAGRRPRGASRSTS